MIEILNVPDTFLVENDVSYPPQNKSKNIESKFYKYLLNENNSSSNLVYIPIQWEKYISENRENLSELSNFIKNLDKSKKYFTICRHTGGPLIDIDNCIIFSPTGANSIYLTQSQKKKDSVRYETPRAENLSYVYIPLLADKYQNIGEKKKIYKGVYLGRNTHPIRIELEKKFRFKRKYKVENLKSMTIDSIKENNASYIDLVSSSYFNFCPRGFGPTSYRIFESIQLNSIPIYISDYFIKPFGSEIDWDKLCLFVSLEEIDKIPSKIDKILATNRHLEMMEYGRYCLKEYFNDDYVNKKIISVVASF